MDTKLKNYNEGKYHEWNSAAGWGYMIGWILLLVCTMGAGILTAMTAAFLQIYRYNLDPDFHFGYYDEYGNWVSYGSVWTGEVTDGAQFYDNLLRVGIAAIAAAVAALVLLVLVMVFTGRFGRDMASDGSGFGQIHLNWYDRIWSEIHAASVFGFGTAFAGLMVLLYDLLPCGNWIGLFTSDYMDGRHYGIPNELALALIVAAMTGSAVFCLTSLVSLVKKLKAHMFWEKSLIGGILLFVWRGVRGSDRTTLKVICYLLVLCAVAGFCGMRVYWYGWNNSFWIFAGAAACILLILLVVPGKIRKLKAIRQGAAAIRGGNLGYKVPVNPGRSGRLDELDRLAVDLNHIGEAQQIAVANELKNQRMKTELISNVSHDLKTPLTSMSAYIDLLKKEGLDSPNAPEYLDIIDKKTQRLKVLTENLFEAAKASSGAIPVTIGEIDLAALATQSLAEMDEKLSARGLTVIVRNQCEGDPDGCRVLADGQLLWRVVENMLGNVSKYALEGSRVYVNISKLVSQRPDRASKVLLEVKNISADPLNISADELMERFKRGDESRNTEGSGLGLAIAKDLTALMGGIFEISIDGDLFKACVVLDEAVSARAIRQAGQAGQAGQASPDHPAKSMQQAASAMTEAGHAAGAAMGQAFSSMKTRTQQHREKSQQRRAAAQQHKAIVQQQKAEKAAEKAAAKAEKAAAIAAEGRITVNTPQPESMVMQPAEMPQPESMVMQPADTPQPESIVMQPADAVPEMILPEKTDAE